VGEEGRDKLSIEQYGGIASVEDILATVIHGATTVILE
jgi:dihydroorotate dehydrogenase